MSNPSVKTVSNSADKVKLGLAVVLFFAGVLGYYILPTYVPSVNPLLVSLGSLVVGVVLGVVLALLSESGKRFVAFAKDAYNESRRVVWPTRKETIQTTGVVIAFVVVTSIFLWLADQALQTVIYNLILGWTS